MALEIKHDETAQEFVALLNQEDIGELAYAMPEEDVIDFQHTFLEKQFRGKGYGDQLIKHGIDYAQEKGYRIMASCPAVSNYLERHPL